MKLYQLLLICFLVVGATSTCVSPCDPSLCPSRDSLDCPFGIVIDKCDCCDVCGVGPGGACGYPFELCGDNLICDINSLERFEEGNGVCVDPDGTFL